MASRGSSETLYQRRVFIDSASNTIGPTGAVKVLLQPNAFTIGPDEQMAIVLRTFEMRYSFFNINQQNNCLCWFDPVGNTFTPINIAPGNYGTFLLLATAIQLAFTTTPGFAGTLVAYTDITRHLSIDLAAAATPLAQPTGFLVSFLVKGPGNLRPAPLTGDQFFNDSNEIYGCFQTLTFSGLAAQLVNAFNVVGPVVYESIFPAALSSIEAIYLRILTVPTNNYSTIGYDFDSPALTGTALSTIFARIPLDLAIYDATRPFITYVDSNNNFPIFLQQKNLDNLIFILTDPAGRPLPETAPNQFSSGHLNYTMCISWEVMNEKATNSRTLQDINQRYTQIKM
jgi:hypothetical protein